MPASSIINFVDLKTVWSPAREEDYNKLFQLGIPMTWVGPDQQDLLKQLAVRNKMELAHTSFYTLEQLLVSRIRAQWKHEFDVVKKDLIFTFPENANPKHWLGLLSALLPWYTRYHIRLEHTVRTKKRGTLVVHTLSRHFADYLIF